MPQIGSKTAARLIDHPAKVFLSGCFGGLATPALEFFAELRAAGLTETFSWGEVLGISGLAFVGGIFVWTQKETDMKKAFFLGVTAPALILGAGDVLVDAPAARQGTGLIPQVLVQPLHAAGQSSSSGTRTITIDADVDVDGDFYTRRDDGFESMLTRAIGVDEAWVLPSDEVVTLRFRGRLEGQIPVETPWTEIPSGTQPIKVRFDPGLSQTFWGGVLDGLGLDNRARAYVSSDATIEILPPQPE